MKIYTKTGDKGVTGLLGGKRVPKCDIRIEAYGTIDELNSYIGFLRDQGLTENQAEELVKIQNVLFAIGSNLASDLENGKIKIPKVKEDDIMNLERSIDNMNENLPEMRNFILPGGNPAVSVCHITRCVCRRAERNIVHLSESEKVDPVILRYVNRLSDYLFMLARKIGFDKSAPETIWKSDT